MGRRKKKKEVKSNDPGQHQSITVKTVMLDPFLAWSLQQNTMHHYQYLHETPSRGHYKPVMSQQKLTTALNK